MTCKLEVIHILRDGNKTASCPCKCAAGGAVNSPIEDIQIEDIQIEDIQIEDIQIEDIQMQAARGQDVQDGTLNCKKKNGNG